MRFTALACDYDGTLADNGRVAPATIAALARLRASGRSLVLVTGRQLPDLLGVMPRPELFDRIVAENGGLLYHPATATNRRLGAPPPASFLEALAGQQVAPLSVGEVVVATLRPHAATVAATIRRQGLALHLSLNKDAVMILPAGVDKDSGLAAAFAELHLSPQDAVAVGDAENDLPLLALCGYPVAVANALPAVRAQAVFVTQSPSGAGVTELIDRMLAGDILRR